MSSETFGPEPEAHAPWIVEDGMVRYTARNQWERSTLMANGFKQYSGMTFERKDSDATRYTAQTIFNGGIG